MSRHRPHRATGLRFLFSAVLVAALAITAGTASPAPSAVASPAPAVIPGATWVPTTAPLPSSAADSAGPKFVVVSCPAAGSCVTVGAFTDTGGLRQGVIDSSDGGTWQSTLAPLPDAAGNPGVNLDALSCPAAGACAAGGWYSDPAGSTQGLLEVLSGGTWTASEAPLPASPAPASDPTANIFGVSCSGPGSCTAVGDYVDTSGSAQGLIDTLSGGTWSAAVAPVPAPVDPDPQLTLTDVSCATATTCAAVGTYLPQGLSQRGVVETLTDGTWSALAAPMPAGADPDKGAFLDAVTCPTAGSCYAVGTYDYFFRSSDPDHGQGLIETLADGTWSPTQAPVPADANPDPGVRLPSISCPTDSFCVTGGYYNDSSAGLLDTLSGGAWSTASAPGLDTTGARVSGVSCPTAGSCQAVGGSVIVGEIWSLGPSGWTSVATPVPPGGNGTQYPGTALLPPAPVSCAAVGSCVAVGLYTDSNRVSRGLIDTLTLPPPPDTMGYWLGAADGGVFSFGNTAFYGSGVGAVDGPVVGLAVPTDTSGYWEVSADGAVLSFGSADRSGSMGGQPLAAPMVGMAGLASGLGYWEVGADGGVFAFGLANFYGSAVGRIGSSKVVGMAATPDGHGYWFVTSSGEVLSFGDAVGQGSMAGHPLAAPIVGIDSTPDGGGYWLVGSDGGVFAFGDATYAGSMGGHPLAARVVGISATPDGSGYWLFGADGGVFSFGGAPFRGSMGGHPLAAPVVGGVGL